MKTLKKYIPAGLITAFGLLTLFLSTTVILDLVGMREKQGNYVLFVIWVNFFCGLAYVASGYGFLKSKKWTVYLLAAAIIALIGTYIAFTMYVNNGGIHKEDTFGALKFRLGITTLFTLIAYYTITKKNKSL